MDLNINLRGRPAKSISAEVVREVNPADLAMLEHQPRSAPQRIKKLRASHHALARAIASGQSNAQASAVTGYDTTYISILLSDPAFQELVAHYHADLDLAFTDVHTKMSIVSSMALEEMRERLEERAGEIGDGTLIEIVKMGADRTGHGPKSTSEVNVNVDLADRLQAARRRFAEGVESCKTIDLQASPSALETAPARFSSRPAEAEEPVV